MKIILASSSEWRRKVLSSLDIKFEVLESGVNEEPIKKTAKSPQALVLKLAKLKAEKIRQSIINNYNYIQYILIAADSVAYLKKGDSWQLFDKPKNRSQARQMLKSLRGKKHNFITGLMVVNQDGEEMSDICISEVTFKNFSDEALEKFLATGGWRSKAGGYDILHQELVAGYTGSYSNICGLPTEKLVPMLKKFSVKFAKNP